MKSGTILLTIFLFMFLRIAAAGKISTLNHKAILTRTYSWVYDSCRFNMKLSFKQSDYKYYRSKSKKTASTQSYVRFLTEDFSRPYLNMVLQRLDSISQPCGFNKSEFAGFIIAFVQQAIFYKKDPFNWGMDYPRYAIETLVDHHGDCEDMACLMLALLRTMNYDVALVTMPGHMAAGIACADCSGRHFIFNGQKYFFVETTGPNNPIGYEADEMMMREHHLYYVPQSACSAQEGDSTEENMIQKFANESCNSQSDEKPCSYQSSSGFGAHVAGQSPSRVIEIREMHVCDDVN